MDSVLIAILCDADFPNVEIGRQLFTIGAVELLYQEMEKAAAATATQSEGIPNTYQS